MRDVVKYRQALPILSMLTILKIFFLERIKILYFKTILRNFPKRSYLKYENILSKNGKYFILFILRKFGQIVMNILRKFLQILKNYLKKKEEL